MKPSFNRRILFDALILGIIGAAAAQLFGWLLHFCTKFFLGTLAQYQSPGLPNEGGTLVEHIGSHGLWLIPLVTTLGGLISGFIIFKWAPEAEGHGTDTVVAAFHKKAGLIRTRVPIVKMIASAITIGSGGSAGREGPIALIASGFGSVYGRWLKRSEKEQRMLILIGMSAGLAAVFRSPVGSAIFAVEVLYSGIEFEAGALIYALLSSVVAYAISGAFIGWRPLFELPEQIQVLHFSLYGLFIVLGVICGLISAVLPALFYDARTFFSKIPIPNYYKPAIGGLGVGLIALVLPQVLGGGYGWLQMAINGQLALGLLIALAFAKMIAFILTISSGGSGGVFAPTLYVGGIIGALVAYVFNQPPAGFIIVGMAALFAGAARVPIAALLMVPEMTGGYQILVPAALAVSLSYLLQTTLTSGFRHKSLYEAQVPFREDSDAHKKEYLNLAFQLLTAHKGIIPDSVENLDLISLFRSTMPIGIPKGKRISVIKVEVASNYAHQLYRKKYFMATDEDQVEMVAMIRNGKPFIPTQDTHMRPADILILLVDENLFQILNQDVQKTS